jgi:hypothetical protein
VLFDPGRIKRGVKPLEDIGAALEAGKSFTLVIEQGWRDSTGAPLVAAYRKQFRVGEADRTPIDPSKWRIGSIVPGTREPLVIGFGEPLDAALAARMIVVANTRGAVKLGPDEQVWHFTPDEPWTAGEHILKVDTALEDLAGNKVGRPFDVDTFERVTRRVNAEVISLPLRVQVGRQ